MSLVMYLDLALWRQHLDAMAARVNGLVPVAKGNGYGFGLQRLARESERLGVDTIAVGTVDEVAVVRRGLDGGAGWSGDIVVLTPWSRGDTVATEMLDDPRVITTVDRLDDLAIIAEQHPRARVILDVLTSMRRHGLTERDLSRVPEVLGGLTLEGWTIHLPLKGDPLSEARELARRCLDAMPAPLWLSHLSPESFAKLTAEVNVETRLRLGTSLWLGAPESRHVTAHVLDLHPVAAGDKVGYWQRTMRRDGWVVVVSGGTANGVALTAPHPCTSLKQRVMTLVAGSMDAAGTVLSPYTLDGRKRTFIEPPHMQSSLLFLPGAATVAIGDEVQVQVRLTTVTVDRIVEK